MKKLKLLVYYWTSGKKSSGSILGFFNISPVVFSQWFDRNRVHFYAPVRSHSFTTFRNYKVTCWPDSRINWPKPFLIRQSDSEQNQEISLFSLPVRYSFISWFLFIHLICHTHHIVIAMRTEKITNSGENNYVRRPKRNHVAYVN